MNLKKIKFNVATAKGIREKEGYSYIDENTGRKLVAHTIYDGAGWNVSDSLTGIQIGSYATNRKDAILYVNTKLRNVLDLPEKLSKYPAIN